MSTRTRQMANLYSFEAGGCTFCFLETADGTVRTWQEIEFGIYDATWLEDIDEYSELVVQRTQEILCAMIDEGVENAMGLLHEVLVALGIENV